MSFRIGWRKRPRSGRAGYGSGYMANVPYRGRPMRARGVGTYTAVGYGGTRRRRGNYGMVTNSSARLKVRRTAPVELKNYDNTLAFAASVNLQAPSNSGNGQLVVGIPQGTNASARIGRRIIIRKILIRGQVTLTVTNTISQDHWFIYVVLDTQTNGVQCNAYDVWDYQGSVPGWGVTRVKRALDYQVRTLTFGTAVRQLSLCVTWINRRDFASSRLSRATSVLIFRSMVVAEPRPGVNMLTRLCR